MKTLRLILIALLMASVHSITFSAVPKQPPVAIVNTSVTGVKVTYIAMRLDDPRVELRVAVANTFPGGHEKFESMIQRLKPLAAVNGAYFSKATLKPIGDIVIDGDKVNSGMMGTAFAIDNNGNPTIRRVVWGHATDWSGYKTVIACGPALVINGDIDVNPEAEGFRDPHVMGAAPRMAIGYTADKHLLLVKMSGGLTFQREAMVMKSLGCVGAMNLDAGASMGMYCMGRYAATPGRLLTNIITIVRK